MKIMKKKVRTKRARTKVPVKHETAVLIKSSRRCALCFHLKGDLEEKHGQIAHLDGDRTNGAENNLMFICLIHHSHFDSRTRQHKNYTVPELKVMRATLYEAIARNEHTTVSRPVASVSHKVDKRILANIVDLMVATSSIDWLRDANFAGWSFDWKRLKGLEQFASQRGPEHEFIDEEIEKLRKAFYNSSRELMGLLAFETFPLGDGDRQRVPEEWEYEQPERFASVVKKIHAAADAACSSYDELVRTAIRKLNR